jgi:Right handed beta helix region
VRSLRPLVLTLLVVGGLGLTACGPTGGTTYYVSTRGKDTNAGTSATKAWRTIGRVNSQDLNPGDEVLFEGGRSFAGELQLLAGDSGTVGSPVEVGSYGSGRATIDGGTGGGITSYNSAGITIRDLRVVGTGRTTNTSHGIQFYNDLPAGDVLLAGIRVLDVEVTGFGKWGVILGGGVGRNGYRDVRFEGVTSSANGDGGLLTWGASPNSNKAVYVGRSVAADNKGVPGVARNTGSGIVLGNVDGGTIEHSVAHHNGGSNGYTQGPVGIWTYDSNAVTIQFNEAYANTTGNGFDGGGFNLDQNTTNSTLQYNYSHDNAGAGLLLAQRWDTAAHHHNTVRYNVSVNDARKGEGGAVQVWGEVRDAEVYHNTVVVAPTAAGSVWGVRISNASRATSDVQRVHLRNNVFATSGGVGLVEVTGDQLVGSSDLRFQGNAWFAGAATPRFAWGAAAFTSLAAWRNGTGQEKVGTTAVGLSADPSLAGGSGVDRARLTSSSPMVDAALDLAAFGVSAGARDGFGGPAPLGPRRDVGAHELR